MLLPKSGIASIIAGKWEHLLVLSCTLISSFSDYRIAPPWLDLRVKMLFKQIKTVQQASGKKMRIPVIPDINIMENHRIQNLDKTCHVL